MPPVATPERTIYQYEQLGTRVDISDEELNRCRIALAQSKRRVVAFYSNPKPSNPAMMLNLSGDMETVVSTMNPFDYYLAHYTTEEILTDAIRTFQPEIVCYFGHAEGNVLQLESSDPRFRYNPMTSEKFIDILKLNHTKMKCIALFACSSAEIARKISAEFKDTHVIFWHTKTLDQGARLFARGFIEYVAKFRSDFDAERAFIRGYKQFAAKFTIGDPLIKYAAWMRELTRARSASQRPDESLRPADGTPGIMVNGNEKDINDMISRPTQRRLEFPPPDPTGESPADFPSYMRAKSLEALQKGTQTLAW